MFDTELGAGAYNVKLGESRVPEFKNKNFYTPN